MKAIRVHNFGDPEVLQLEEVEDLQPSAGQVLIQVKAAGVNPVETYIRSGAYPMRPPLPYTPGTDAAGEVVRAGPAVEGFRPGDRVYASGTETGAYAAQALCRPEQLHPLPELVQFEQGAALGIPYGTAYRALFQRAHAREGESVLIHGASGGVGLAAVQLARAAGLKVTGTAGSEEGARLVMQQGAEQVLRHDQPGYLDGADGSFDLVLEMLANENLPRDLAALRRGGRIVVIGSRGTVEIDPRMIMVREAAVYGMVLFNAPPEDLRSAYEAIDRALESGDIRPVIDRALPLQEAPEAHRLVMGSGSKGKIVLIP